ncbi:MAG: OsmC family protein [Gemmatimonadetes bacterium]|nr:OsmC family protein [Gemmatimonadota bacterium]
MPDTRNVRVEWREGLRFIGGVAEPGRPTAEIDGDGKTAPGPMSVLLMCCASCSGVDVVDLLAKMRVKLTRFAVEVTGVRRDEPPRRYVSIHLRYIVAGDGLERHHAERAVNLSVEKYCSVIASLSPDIALTHEVVLD